ncbi:hypothetical protein ABXT06_20185 [Flavobacterium sp. UW10123]|uniref:hypothetical protein n=1 Tax=Flavobacterium sp. UW10123 TaxID=3230800 RepID=UPI0033934B0E
MKKKVFLLFVIASIACSANELKMEMDSSITKDSLKLVKKVAKYYTNGMLEGEEIITFFYENNLISKIESKIDDKFTGNVEVKYENGKIKEMIEYIKPLNSVNEISILRVYNYDKDLIVNAIESNGQRKVQKVYSYNDLKQIVKCQITEAGKTVAEEIYLYDKKGNLSERKYKGASSNHKTFYKAYDDKYNSFALLYSEAYLKIISSGKNNLVYSYNNEGENEKYDYEYNSENYPIKITMRKNNEIKTITTIQYE